LIEVEAHRTRIKVALVIRLVIQPNRCCVYNIRGNHELDHKFFILFQDIGWNSKIRIISRQLCDLLNILLVVPLINYPEVGELRAPSRRLWNIAY